VVSNGLNNAATSSVANLNLLPTPNTRLARWDFNVTSVTNNVPASSGSGTASLVGGTTATFANGTFSDPAGPPGTGNQGWNTTAYSSLTTSNKQRGVQFKVSTAGHTNILLVWEQRQSPAASKYFRLQYS